jgi:hypothetical protein
MIRRFSTIYFRSNFETVVSAESSLSSKTNAVFTATRAVTTS